MGLFDKKERTRFYRDNPRIQAVPTTQVEWNDFTQELGKVMFEKKGSFTPTWTGFSSDPVGGAVYWSVSGSTATLVINTSTTGTSDASTFTINNLPELLQPSKSQMVAVNSMVDAGTNGWGNAVIESDTITFCFQDTDGASWTSSGDKGFGNASSTFTSITYSLIA